MGTFEGVEVRVSPALIGGKRAVRFGGGPIHVSPAMYDLMRHADPAELRRLMESIEVLNLPAAPDYTRHLPMTVTPPASASRGFS